MIAQAANIKFTQQAHLKWAWPRGVATQPSKSKNGRVGVGQDKK